MRIGRLALLLPIGATLLAAASLALFWSMSASGRPVSGADDILVHPAYTTSLLAKAALEGREPFGEPLRARMAAALRDAPLEDEPFTLAAYEQFSERRLEAAQRLLATARQRNPRSREARLLAVDVNLAANDIASVVGDLEALLRLKPADRAVLEETLVLLAGHPDTRLTTLKTVKDEATRKMILVGLARTGAGAPALVEAMQTMELEGRLGEDLGTAGAVTQPLVTAGNYDAAFQVWSKLAGVKLKPSGLRDSRFQQRLPPPFGWQLTSGRDGSVAVEPAGLAGQVYGRRTGNLARQLLILRPGSHRLEIAVTEPSELVEVALRCMPGQEIAKQRLSSAGTLHVSFVVPDGCSAQWLELNARASDPPQSGSFRIRAVELAGESP